MNNCQHKHQCFECRKPYTCEHPECQTLEGLQRLCDWCSYYYGWRQKDRGALDDWSAL